MALLNFRGFEMSSSGQAHVRKLLKAKQKKIDSEVLRLCAPLMPKQTGALISSGVAKDGVVEYTAGHAKEQYYNTKTSRPYDGNRGGKWFERMKTTHKGEILATAEKEGG